MKKNKEKRTKEEQLKKERNAVGRRKKIPGQAEVRRQLLRLGNGHQKRAGEKGLPG